ncbi:ligand-dependent nuclear receptor-interacting factor 1-like [Leptodactylus fuscus]|uniref:ligand-dependent nuclear receptor-interacting factor 1 n=1 Tax=Leptodactylus fuscus TaxID=238119 RepID=UPI003F4F345A
MSNLARLPQTPGHTAASNQCLTGCLYQVIQTTGLQGSNVLKLLPILKSKDNLFPVVPSPVTPSAPSLHVPQAVISSPLPPPPVSILSRPSPVSVPLVQTPALGNFIIAAQNNLPHSLHVENPFPVSQETTLFLDNAQLTLPTNSLPGNPRIIMMNAKSSNPMKPTPLLPSGHSLQIPAHAEVISVPVSSLPFSIQQKILPQASGTDVGKMPSVIYVSPVNTIKANNNQSAQPYLSPNTSSLACGAKSPPQQKIPPSRAEIPKGPMKWVVQESRESAACLVPVKSSNDTASKILQMLSKTKMEEVNLTNPDQSKMVQIKDNALVMCNNRIFFLTKKGSELNDAGSKNLELPQHAAPEKPAAPVEPARPTQDLSNRVVQVVLSKNKSPPPSAEESVQSNVVSTAKPKRKSFTPQAVRGDPSVIYIADEDDDHSVKPQDAACSLPPPADTSVENTTNNRDSVKTKDQLIPKSQDAEILTAVNVMDDRGWRKKFGLVKKEKIILKKVPLVRPQGTSQSTSCSQGVTNLEEETERHQWKRKSSSRETLKAPKKQKSTEDGDLTPNPLHLGVSADPPSPSPVSGSYSVPGGRSPSPKTTERSSSTWSPTYHGAEASNPPDIVDFQVSQDITEHFSEVSLPSQRFHIDSMYPDDTTKDEKIQRLKEVLKEREKALEALRRQKRI